MAETRFPSDPFENTDDIPAGAAPQDDPIAPAGGGEGAMPSGAAVPPEAAGPGPRRARLIDWRPVRRIGWRDVLVYALLVAILAAGGWLRFDAQNWDDYTHLHPDERFLTDVVSLLNGSLQFTDTDAASLEAHRLRCEARYPADIPDTDDETARLESLAQVGRGGYFDAECSPLNPNNLGKGLYVYGEFPLFTVHLAGAARSELARDYHTLLETFDPEAAATHRITTYWETYTGAQLIGRSVSAAADWLTILVLFLLGRRLYGRWVGLFAAAFYAFAAFPIQQSHFWTVDAFTTLWVTLALYCAVRALDGASALRGAPVLAYLALWAGAVIWEAAYWERPVIGVALLGGIVLAVVAAIAVLRLTIPAGLARTLTAGAGALAALFYLVAVTVLDAVAPRAFPLTDGLLALGVAALLYGLAVLLLDVVAGVLRAPQRIGQTPARSWRIVIALGVMWLALMAALLLETVAPWAALLVAFGGVALLIVDATELADYALFGLALGGAVASRVNVAPLAGIIVVAAGVRLLPAFDRAIDRTRRAHIVSHALSGVIVAAFVSLVAFRLLQPHAFLGPEIWGLRINPGWWEDVQEAATMTNGSWDAPPNHQWASRTPYFFPWRNIVLWGFGLPLGLAAWAAWAWAGWRTVRGRPNWTRHIVPFLWVLVVFVWLGGRWVTTMRYFLPIYPPLALFAAWGLVGLVAAAWRAMRSRPRLVRRLAFGGAAVLLALVTLYTTLFGFGFHTIERQQLTRVAASRWFQETVPGDFGVWIEGEDGARQMVNLGRGMVYSPPDVLRIEQGETASLPFSIMSEARLRALTFHHLGDPMDDDAPEMLRVRIWRNDPFAGQQLVWGGTLEADFADTDVPYGTSYRIEVEGAEDGAGDEEDAGEEAGVMLAPFDTVDPMLDPYVLEVTALEGGPIFAAAGVIDPNATSLGHVTLALESSVDETMRGLDLTFDTPALITGYADDVPAAPTQWTPGGSDSLAFQIPIDGAITSIEIPHLGDPLDDATAETVHFTLVAPDGESRTVTVSEDLSAGADPLGAARTLTIDPPLDVQKFDAAGNAQVATLIVEAENPIYTSGPVIAWEGDWDDPIPWPVCPLPDDVQYRDDLPSGLSSYDCASISMYGAHYQGIKLWMLAGDDDGKYTAMTNALDQADYLVITSNRFYDSLSRIPMRWPMTMAFYDALFDGRLGFELVKTFESYPSVGPVTIPDEILPTDDLPAWLNEHWEAEEAYHVYDHPAVLVFRKTDAYTPENTAAILNSVSRRAVNTAIPGYTADSEPVGVFSWGALQASEAPTLLEFTEEQWDIQHAGGTWSELFDLDALVNENQVVAVIAWWLLISIVGWLAWPLLFAALPALPDRAFPAARITAWLLVAWIAWVGGTLQVLTWTQTGLALIVLGLALVSGLVAWRRRADLWLYLRANRRHLLLVEGLTLLLFLGFVGVRLGNPDLWQPGLGGEKPMDFAYLNGVLRSTIFPPIDPWFSQGYINYYYFGYVIVGAPIKLLGLDPAIAYNLVIPTLYAMTGIGVFSIAYNWVRARAVTPGQIAGATRDFPPAAPAAEVEQVEAGEAVVFARDVEDGSLDDTAEIVVATDVAADESDAVVIVPAKPLLAEPLPARPEPRAPRGSAWLAGVLALLLAVVLGNLGTVLVFGREVAATEGWQQQPFLSDVRRAELEAERDTIYQDFYREAVGDFQDEHDGLEPTEQSDLIAIASEAQQRTEDYIEDAAQHPPLVRIWEYGLDNLAGQLRAFFKGLNDMLHGEPLQIYSNRWHWAPTRIISELPNGVGHNAINEMPYFTFLYGDLHAHMISMPVYLLAFLWLLGEIIGAGHALRRGWQSVLALALGGLAVGVLRPTNTWDWITFLILGVAGLTYAAWIGATWRARRFPPSKVAGRLWDLLRPGRARELWPVLLIVPLAVVGRIAFYFLRRMQADQQLERGLRAGETLIDPTLTLGGVLVWIVAALAVVALVYVALLIMLRAYLDQRVLLGWLGRVALFVGIVFAVALPFTAYFATPYNAVQPWEAERTPLWAYVYIHGIFLFIVISFLVWQSARWLRRVRVRQLEGLAVPVLAVLGAVIAAVLASLWFGVREVPVAQLVVPLIAWATVLFFLPRQAPLLRVIYAIIVLALAISLGVELIVLEGDIGRQNTVFKFYLQVWFFLSIVSGVALAWMLRVADGWRFGLRAAWQGALVLLLSIGLMYPLLATPARFQDRFNKAETPLTLNGMEYMLHARHAEGNMAFSLEGDYELIRWFQQNVEGSPVVVEGRVSPSEYHWYGRISIYTGLPSVLGWRWHQTQQRGLDSLPLLVQTRENNVAAIYTLPDAAVGRSTGADATAADAPEMSEAERRALQAQAMADAIRTAWNLLQHYEVEYIVVGSVEHAIFGDVVQDPGTGTITAGNAPGLAKFNEMVELGLLEVAYQSEARCADYTVAAGEACPAEAVYYDRVYHVVPGATLPDAVAELAEG